MPSEEADSEHVRLVISNETRVTEADTVVLQPQTERSNRPFKWWIKTLIFSVIAIIVSIVLFKWGVPFIFEKVYSYYYFMEFSHCFCYTYWFHTGERIMVMHYPEINLEYMF